ncbi:MAG: oxidoreductase [Gammaproteobacteria bacterium]|nr:MAG: oxidoreductase [Gammaproteobacteria bacterium]RLA60439.1 MAG: oxidoreductase [Gammaproteobacteria bacterium]
MPSLIKKGAIVEDDWSPVDPESPSPSSEQIYSLDQWLQLEDKAGSAVQIEPGQSPAPLFDFLQQIALVVVNFPVFTDGRGFSYARELRERGYGGELRATGHFIRDQLTYLQRCGFDAFQMADESLLEESLAGLADFSEHYQGSTDQPLPLFRRRV